MTALIITAIVSVAAIIACYHILYRRLKRLMEAWYSSLAHYFNKSVIIVSDVQARIDEIEEELNEAADIKDCGAMLRSCDKLFNNNNEPTN